MTHQRRQRGQSMVEFCIVVPLFLFLCLLVLQLVLIYRAKSTLDYAALEAARAGAVSGVDHDQMHNGLARGLAPLWVSQTSTAHVLYVRQVTMLREKKAPYSQLKVLSPTPAMWNDFRERQYDGRLALPNDTLAFRPTHIGNGGATVQDANILRIQVRYQFPLIVPFVDRVLIGVSRLLNNGPDYRPTDAPFLWAKDPVTGHYRLPLVSTAEVRLQSPVYDRGNLR